MTDRFPLLRLRVAVPTVLVVLAVLAAPAAEARRLVEPGDLLVGAGNGVFVVRADGGGVAPFSPREGSGGNQLTAPAGVVVDGARARVVVADRSAKLLLVDPDDGTQTRVENNLGGNLDLGDQSSGLDILADGSLLVGRIDITSGIPFTTYQGRVDLVTAPNNDAQSLVAPASDPIDGGIAGLLLGVAVAEPSFGDRQLLVSTYTGFGSALATVSPAGEVTTLANIPVQPDAFVTEPDVDCTAGLASLCLRYWVEARIVELTCIPSDASVYRSGFGGTQEIFSGAPLRCPLAVEAASSGNTVFVLDADADFSDPRVYRLDYDAFFDEWDAVQIADETELPDLANTHLPGLTISSVALPEPMAGAGAVAAIGGLALLRIGRSASRAPRVRPPPRVQSAGSARSSGAGV